MAFQLPIFCLIVLAYAASNTDALMCWTCSSDNDVNCNDLFNTTHFLNHPVYNNAFNQNYQPQQNYQGSGNFPQQQNFPQNRPNGPYLKNCDDATQRIYNRKSVCMKKIQSSTNGRRYIIRECHVIGETETVGTCPTESNNRNLYVEYCRYCDHDGCNTATGIKTNIFLASLAPLILVFSRK